VKKAKTAYVCSECGASALQWFGSCPSCGAAGSLTETIAERGARPVRSSSPTVALADVQPRNLERIATGIGELDRALGGGLVPGQVTLLGGDPGIGKSTLLLQALSTFSAEVLYLTGEERLGAPLMRALAEGRFTSALPTLVAMFARHYGAAMPPTPTTSLPSKENRRVRTR